MIEETPERYAVGRHYVVATDGACKGNPGTGGWGAVIQLRDGAEVIKQRALAEQGEVMISTNNKMEMTAAIRALEKLAEPLPVILMSDSEYVVLGITERMSKWKANGWRTSDNKPAKNLELWQQLDQLSTGRSIQWKWVRGHRGHKLNEMANTLADQGALGMFPDGEKSVRKRYPAWFK